MTKIDPPNGGHVFSPEKVTAMGPFTRSTQSKFGSAACGETPGFVRVGPLCLIERMALTSRAQDFGLPGDLDIPVCVEKPVEFRLIHPRNLT